LLAETRSPVSVIFSSDMVIPANSLSVAIYGTLTVAGFMPAAVESLF